MRDMLPDRETAKRQGWAFQVQWIERGFPCFIRKRSKEAAERFADQLRAELVECVEIIDLDAALRLH